MAVAESVSVNVPLQSTRLRFYLVHLHIDLCIEGASVNFAKKNWLCRWWIYFNVESIGIV